MTDSTSGFGRNPNGRLDLDNLPANALKQRYLILENAHEAQALHVDRLKNKLKFRVNLGHAFSNAVSKVTTPIIDTAKSVATTTATCLRAPFLIASYFAAGPLAAATHQLIGREHFDKIWDNTKTAGYGASIVALLVGQLALNAGDAYYTTHVKYPKISSELIHNTPCIDGNTTMDIGIKKCNPVIVPSVKHTLPWLLASDEGIAPYMIHRAHEVTHGTEITIENGITGKQLCHRFGTITEVAYDLSNKIDKASKYDYDSEVVGALSAIKYSQKMPYKTTPWKCEFKPS